MRCKMARRRHQLDPFERSSRQPRRWAGGLVGRLAPKRGYFVASVPALHGCHTQAKALDVVMQQIQEAIELWLEVE